MTNLFTCVKRCKFGRVNDANDLVLCKRTILIVGIIKTFRRALFYPDNNSYFNGFSVSFQPGLAGWLPLYSSY